MADLLWDELVEEERAALGKRAVAFFEADRGTACQFWQRRRRLAAWTATASSNDASPPPGHAFSSCPRPPPTNS